MKICIVYEHDSQEKVANQLAKTLDGHELHLVDVKANKVRNSPTVAKVFDFEVVILTIGGADTRDFVREMEVEIRRRESNVRPLILSLTVGVTLDRTFYGTFSPREPADVLLVNRVSDVARVRRMCEVLHGGPVPDYKVLPALCPIFDVGARKPVDYEAPVRSICFAVQTDIPNRELERRYIAARLLDYARAFPDRTVIVKPRHRLGEQTAHIQKFPYERLLRREARGEMPANLIISYDAMTDLIATSDLIISVSSTAVIESLVLGKRCAIIADFGLSEPLGTSFFLESGLLATFDELIADKVPRHSEAWLDEQLGAPTVPTVIRSLEAIVARAAAGELALDSATLRRLSTAQAWLAKAGRPKKKRGQPKKKSLKWKVLNALDRALPKWLTRPAELVLRRIGII